MPDIRGLAGVSDACSKSMMSEFGPPERPTSTRHAGWVVLLGVAALMGVRFAYVVMSHLLVDEGPVPSRSFDPEIPVGATLLSSEINCASGGCWRELHIDPPEGLSAQELAQEMGIESKRCTLLPSLDVLSVCITSEVGHQSNPADAPLQVYIRYWSPIGSQV